jgi:branched-chain amino acid transport system substrate-binding protein
MNNKGLLIGLLILAVLAFSCTDKNHIDKVEIGVVVFKTGGAASYGEKSLNGMNLAVEQINSNPDNTKIELIIEDDQSKPEKAVTAFNSLLAKKPNIPVYISALTSSSTLAISPIAERNKKVLFSPCSSSPDITNAGDYIFRNWPSDEVEGQLMANYALIKGYKKVVVISINNAYGQGLKDVFIDHFTKNEGEIVQSISFDEGQMDFKTIASRFSKNNDIDAIYAPSHAKEAGSLIRAFREQGYNKPFLGCVTYESEDIFTTGGNDLENVYLTTPWFDINNNSSKVKEFTKNYKAKFNSIPDNFSAQSYDAIKLIYSAVINSGYNADSIKNYLYQVDGYNGVSGLTSFDSNGDVLKPAMLKKIVDNKFIVVDEIK